MLDETIKQAINACVQKHAGDELSQSDRMLFSQALQRDYAVIIAKETPLAPNESEFLNVSYYLGSRYFSQEMLCSRDFIWEQLGVFFDGFGMRDRVKGMLLLEMQHLAWQPIFLKAPLWSKPARLYDSLLGFIRQFASLGHQMDGLEQALQQFVGVLAVKFDPSHIHRFVETVQPEAFALFPDFSGREHVLNDYQLRQANMQIMFEDLSQKIQSSFSLYVTQTLDTLRGQFYADLRSAESSYETSTRFWRLIHNEQYSREALRKRAFEICQRHINDLSQNSLMSCYEWECFQEQHVEVCTQNMCTSLFATYLELTQVDERPPYLLQPNEVTSYVLIIGRLADIIRGQPYLIHAFQRSNVDLLYLDWDVVKAGHMFFNLLRCFPPELHRAFFQFIDNPEMDGMGFLSAVNDMLAGAAVEVAPIVKEMLDDPNILNLFERVAESYKAKESAVTEHVLRLSEAMSAGAFSPGSQPSSSARPSMG